MEGLSTVAGAGDPKSRNGVATHIYACNSSMKDKVRAYVAVTVEVGHKSQTVSFRMEAALCLFQMFILQQ